MKAHLNLDQEKKFALLSEEKSWKPNEKKIAWKAMIKQKYD